MQCLTPSQKLMKEPWNLRKNRASFLLLEALASMMLISIFIVVFINITSANSSHSALPSYASNILYKEVISSKCGPKTSSKMILGMQLNQSYKYEFDDNLKSNIIVQYFDIDDKIVLKRRCYI